METQKVEVFKQEYYIADICVCEHFRCVIYGKVALLSYTSASQKQLNKKQKPLSARRER